MVWKANCGFSKLQAASRMRVCRKASDAFCSNEQNAERYSEPLSGVMIFNRQTRQNSKPTQKHVLEAAIYQRIRCSEVSENNGILFEMEPSLVPCFHN